MILKALYDYYHRLGNLPKKGLELKEIGYLIVIDNCGTFLRIESRMIDKKHAQVFLVSQTVQRSGRKFISNYLWDNCEYVTGYSEKNQEKAVLCNNAFINRVEELKKMIPQNITVNAIYNFYNKYPSIYDVLKNDILWKEMSISTKNVSFLLNGSASIAAVEEDVIRLSVEKAENADLQVCLITGSQGKIARVHTKVPFQGNAFSSLVSFKDGKGYDSYGKEQGANAPISEEAEFAYTTALNHLLESDSRNKFTVGNRTFLFWASKDDEAGRLAEKSIFSIFDFNESDDDPNRRIEQVRKVLKSIYSGSLKTTLDDKFYILGLAPNAARIAVTYWAEIPLKEFASRINQHFEDMDIVDSRKEKKPYAGLASLLKEVTLQRKISGSDSKLQPNLPESVIKSIFQGTPYPYTLYSACIRRILAETSEEKNPVHIARAAIIKGYLNRLNNNQTKIDVMLDKDNTNPGYLCGRLFAVIDRIQEIVNKQNTIRNRYMNAASSTPVTVFPTIINLSNHHAEKLEVSKKFFDELKGEIINKIDAEGFPTQLDLQDQGRFFIGYYHQRQELITNKGNNTETNNS
jgi:CRISPR-associated protein Csd1